ncbi:MAG: hypothetical protein QN229_07330 [Desulfurococcaceae archaeon TW002]
MLTSLREFERGGINALGSELLKTSFRVQPSRETSNVIPLNLRLLSGAKDFNRASVSRQSSSSSNTSTRTSLTPELLDTN